MALPTDFGSGTKKNKSASKVLSMAEQAAAMIAANKASLSKKKVELIAIGSSTGGTEALSKVLPKLQPPLPPVLIVQHIPEGFSKLFAERMNKECSLTIKEAANGDVVRSNTV